MADRQPIFTEKDIEEMLSLGDKAKAGLIADMAFASIPRGSKGSLRDKTLLALNSPHSAMDNNPLGLGDDPPSQDTTSIFEGLKKLKPKKPTLRNVFMLHTPADAPTSPLPKEMLDDTSSIWHRLNKKEK